jgi:hypothetical protein
MKNIFILNKNSTKKNKKIDNEYMNDLIIPGIFVNHPKKKDWGIGQVQSKIGDIITVNFENAGKKTINGKEIELEIIKNEL